MIQILKRHLQIFIYLSFGVEVIFLILYRTETPYSRLSIVGVAYIQHHLGFLVHTYADMIIGYDKRKPWQSQVKRSNTAKSNEN